MNKYFFFIGCILLYSCTEHLGNEKRKTERSYYYWKSVFALSDHEKHVVDSLHVSTLYLKFFDVDWNDAIQQPNPVAQVRINDTGFLNKRNIIPVVFITNECIAKIDLQQSGVLAEKIDKLVKEVITINKLSNINEIQIDCDWTSTSKEKYFALLTRLSALVKPWKISATIRLHQVKYVSKSGIPPVDKGLLMCYNMGNLKDPSTQNSIIDREELKKYIGGLSKYPLPLDVAFPLFDWKVLFRNNHYAGLVQHLSNNVLNNGIAEKKGNQFLLLKDTVLAGFSFKKNDILRDEQSDYSTVLSAAKEINDRLAEKKINVSLYHLDSITLSKYNIHELENIYNSIH
jgi:hypothetical protein